MKSQHQTESTSGFRGTFVLLARAAPQVGFATKEVVGLRFLRLCDLKALFLAFPWAPLPQKLHLTATGDGKKNQNTFYLFLAGKSGKEASHYRCCKEIQILGLAYRQH